MFGEVKEDCIKQKMDFTNKKFSEPKEETKN